MNVEDNQDASIDFDFDESYDESWLWINVEQFGKAKI